MCNSPMQPSREEHVVTPQRRNWAQRSSVTQLVAAEWELELKSTDPIGTMLTRPVLLLPSGPRGPLVLTCFVSLIPK